MEQILPMKSSCWTPSIYPWSSALGSISDKPNYLAHERDSILLTHSPEIYSISSQADTWLGSLLWLFWVQWMKFSKGSLQSICQFYSISKSVAWTLSLRLIASTQPCKEGLTEWTFFSHIECTAFFFLRMSHATENWICSVIRSSMAFYTRVRSRHSISEF